MTDLNDITIKTYKEHFERYKAETPSMVSGEIKDWMDRFLSYLPDGGLIFELGSATGRDARYFISKGYQVKCTDIIPDALNQLENQGFDTEIFDFRDEPKKEWENQFDGYFANAVLLHAKQEIFEKCISNISKVLKRGGVAAFSLKTGEGEEMTEGKMDAPRYFNYHTEEEIRELISKLPFEILDLSLTDDKKWLHVILKSK